ncbi:MAG: hypothetical protein F4Z39_09345 [Chloroflexi bacterium]|nr:hypothetical protein [Chloroflexota bacterium]
MTLKRSDVLITRPCSMEVYRRYRATGLGWGFLPEPDRRGLPPDEEMMRDVDEAHRCGVKFQGRVELDADWMGMIDFDSNFMESTVRDLDNRPAITWWTHTYKGHPAYHYCTNAPGYRHYLFYQLQRVMSAGTDWLMIDSAIPTIGTLNARYGGCFCQHCMVRFREFLRETMSPGQLQLAGIQGIDCFDYGEVLRMRGITDQRYRAEILAFPPTLPLANAYFDFQWREVNTLFRAFKRVAQTYGEHVPMSSNSPFFWAEFMYAVDAHDFYTTEMQYKPPEDEILPSEPIYTFKLADALDKLIAITGVPSAFEPYRLQPRPGHICLWIAQAYAHGHVFMVPDKMWTLRSPGEADRWYYADTHDYTELYHFVREYPQLFDDYEALAPVALVFSNNAVRQYLSERLNQEHLGGQNRSAPQTQLVEACLSLSRANIPFRLLVAGDDWVADRLLNADLTAYRAIVRFKQTGLNARQEEKLRSAGEKLLTYSEPEDLLSQLDTDIEITGAVNISALPRYKPGDKGATIVCHLLNANYDFDTDKYKPARDFDLRLESRLLNRTFTNAWLYAPGVEARKIACRADSQATIITVPELEMWAIVQLA